MNPCRACGREAGEGNVVLRMELGTTKSTHTAMAVFCAKCAQSGEVNHATAHNLLDTLREDCGYKPKETKR